MITMKGNQNKRVPNPNGAPKKPTSEKKVQVSFCIKQSIFDAADGKKAIQETCIGHLEEKTGISNK